MARSRIVSSGGVAAARLARDRADRRSGRPAPIGWRSRNSDRPRSSSRRSSEPEARSVGHCPQRSATSAFRPWKTRRTGLASVRVLDRIGADRDIAAQAVGVEPPADFRHERVRSHVAGRGQDRDLARSRSCDSARRRLSACRPTVRRGGRRPGTDRGSWPPCRARSGGARDSRRRPAGCRRRIGRPTGSPRARAPPRRGRRPRRFARPPARWFVDPLNHDVDSQDEIRSGLRECFSR